MLQPRSALVCGEVAGVETILARDEESCTRYKPRATLENPPAPDYYPIPPFSSSSLAPLFLSAGRISLCRGPRSSSRSAHSTSKNPWMRPVCLQSSFRDKDETMIDRRREGSLERREIILFFYIYPVDTSTGIDS